MAVDNFDEYFAATIVAAAARARIGIVNIAPFIC